MAKIEIKTTANNFTLGDVASAVLKKFSTKDSKIIANNIIKKADSIDKAVQEILEDYE